jgi:hypothetical protein
MDHALTFWGRLSINPSMGVARPAHVSNVNSASSAQLADVRLPMHKWRQSRYFVEKPGH